MNAYEAITARILAQLERGTVPWQQPWRAAGLPRNLLSQKPYRGVNVWLLASCGYACPYWLTFNQARQIGGSVKGGEHGERVVFWKFLPATSDGQEGEEQPARRPPLARLYTVFNALQCELPERLAALVRPAALQPGEDAAQLAACAQIVAAMPRPPALTHREAQAYYRPATDTVNMPALPLFAQPARYYSTLFHELTHATGHASRLDRDTLRDMVAFGSANYSKEELVAELGAAFLCGAAGIDNATVDNSAAYLAHWLERLRNDRTLFVQAAAQAQKAADYILGTKLEAADKQAG